MTHSVRTNAKSLPIAAIAAGVLLLLTLADAYRLHGNPAEPASRRNAAQSREVAARTWARCALYHARFGGQRAQLVQVMQGGVANFVVMEIGKRDPLLRVVRSRWLSAAYGEGEHIWLGEFSSAEAAMARAAQYCPPALRCWPGEAGCGPKDQLFTPARAFFAL
jgi:hypothetical protein